MTPENEPNESSQALTGEGQGKEPATQPENKGPTVEEQLAAIRAENEELRTVTKGAVREAEASKMYVAQLTQRLTEAAERAGQGNGNGAGEPDIRDQMNENPLKVLDDHFRARTAPLVNTFAESQATLRKELFLTRTDPKLIKKYGKEVEEFMSSMPPDTRAREGSWDAALRWVRSHHIDEEVAERQQESAEAEKRSFVEQSSAAERGGKVPRSLSDLEKTIAKNLEVSEDDYVKFKYGEE